MYGQANNPYQYGGNFGTAFLQDNMEQMAGVGQQGLSGSFQNVMGSLQTGIQTSAQNGISPFGGGNQPMNLQAAQAQRLGVPTIGGMTAQQISAQMNTGGAMSVLPMIGMGALPQLVFPLAGVYSLVDGIRSIRAVGRDAKASAGQGRFDPAQLSYNKTMAQIETSNDHWSHLGPLN